ncbi:MAG TPA: cysteine--tRNA ligase [Stellaceae bacterium]|nr:cysteine--tRNA ligase [Stellaceae bacterium]
MPLALHNTLTRRREVFKPIDPSNVRLYVCGPTVYDVAHIGNARPVIVFDVLYRVLRQIYGVEHVRYVRNITDVEDKIAARAAENGETIRALTERTAAVYAADMAALLCLEPDLQPRATEHIEPMVAMILRLIEKGFAYEAEGHVLFSVTSMPTYGRLSRRSRDDMLDGARVEVAPYKRDGGDFVLWKPSSEEMPGWDSPWGRGRPGWHIECSAMSKVHLGEHFDIHGGGVDLVFPHHENELAQSTCAHDGRPFVNYWVHNAFLDVEGRKMSKSLGNFVTPNELLKEAPGEAIRLAMLTVHYRDPIDWTAERLRQARLTLERFYTALRAVADIEAVEPARPVILDDLEDDLNTPLALTHLHELATELNKAALTADKARLKGALLSAGRVLGLLEQEPESYLKWRPSDADGLDDAEIERLVTARWTAKQARDWPEADRLRKLLTDAGIQLEDGSDGTQWRRSQG